MNLKTAVEPHRLPWFIAAACIAALAAFAVTRHLVTQRAPDEMTWLREEFRLTPSQLIAVERLHRAYEPVCADHCRRISEARRRLRDVEADPNTSAADHAAAHAAWQALCDECTTATRAHLEAVAAQMSPDQGKRYLDLVGPKLTRRDPGKPFGLR